MLVANRTMTGRGETGPKVLKFIIGPAPKSVCLGKYGNYGWGTYPILWTDSGDQSENSLPLRGLGGQW